MSESLVSKDYKSTSYCMAVTLNASLGAIYVGYAIGVMNLMQPVMEVVYDFDQYSDHYQSILKGMQNCTMNLGAMAGALSAPALLIKFGGRRKSMLITDLIGIIGCLLIFPNNYWVTTWVSRLICGYAVGLNSAIVPMYINEIAPKELKGLLGTCFQQSVNIGIVLSYAFCLIFPTSGISADYKVFWWVYCIPIITSVLRIFLLSTVFNFDTPVQCIKDANEQGAKQVLAKIYKEEKVQDMLDELTSSEETKQRTWGDMFSKKYNRRTWQAILLQFFQQFSGINAINYYSNDIFSSLTGNDQSQTNIFVLVGGLSLVVGCLFTGALARKFGRKTLLVVNEVTLTIILSIVAIVSILQDNASADKLHTLQITGAVFIFIFLGAFQLGLGPIVWCYIPEIVPGESCAIATMVNYFAGAVLGLIFPSLLNATSTATCFFIFAGVCLIGFVFMQTQMIETKGKTPAEIEEEFGQGGAKTRDD